MRTRRSVLLGLLAWPALPASVVAAPASYRAVRLHNIHTGEQLDQVYWAHGGYLPKALVACDHLLRDHHLQRVFPIDRRLIDLLWIIQTALRAERPIEVLSGYRSAMTNRLLAYRGEGVAQHSYHVQGKAVDIRVPGHALPVVLAAARAAGYGGVGRYSGFVHVDVGPVRHWG